MSETCRTPLISPHSHGFGRRTGPPGRRASLHQRPPRAALGVAAGLELISPRGVPEGLDGGLLRCPGQGAAVRGFRVTTPPPPGARGAAATRRPVRPPRPQHRGSPRQSLPKLRAAPGSRPRPATSRRPSRDAGKLPRPPARPAWARRASRRRTRRRGQGDRAAAVGRRDGLQFLGTRVALQHCSAEVGTITGRSRRCTLPGCRPCCICGPPGPERLDGLQGSATLLWALRTCWPSSAGRPGAGCATRSAPRFALHKTDGAARHLRGLAGLAALAEHGHEANSSPCALAPLHANLLEGGRSAASVSPARSARRSSLGAARGRPPPRELVPGRPT